ncbi:phage tail sheath family protein [Paenibacillus kribbensis]|uniref:phage tail sheath family protein n=1 Tax=Paenibacillus kribbensis TaxID=172713 RepID=UPI002DB919C4|nr:phage tail sheath family protein [Paenibacillus kribbensis]MEC0234460.1 phage tail sheath family protein [Paenibacillus kribbensis]
MAGGTWVTQNQKLPGVYINIETAPAPLGALGDRGVTSLPLSMSWGPSKTLIAIDAGADVSDVLGYDITDPKLILIKEALKNASRVLLYRLNTGTKATVTVGNLVATAFYGGVRGNDITLVTETNVDEESKVDVVTLLAGVERDRQTVATAGELTANSWVTFSGTGELTETAGAPLTGGADGTVINSDHTDYLGTIEVQNFNTIAFTFADATLKSVYVAFAKRMRDAEGKYIQVVLSEYPNADTEGVISVKNGVVLADGTTITAAQACAWVAGATAGANVNESLTSKAYEDAADVTTRYTRTQLEAAADAGEFVFTTRPDGTVIVLYDINTLTSFTPKKGKVFRKNRVIRVLDSIGNDFQQIFSKFYIGKVSNNANGRNLFKNECVDYIVELQNIEAVQNFDSQDDISVQQGTEADAVLINMNIQPVDSAEKFYFKITVS